MKTRLLTAALLAGASVAAAGAAPARRAAPVGAPHAAARPSDAEVDRRVDALLARMTPEEKAGQLFMFTSFSPPPGIAPNEEKAIVEGRVGAFFLINDPDRINAIQKLAVEKSRLGIPLLFGLDAIHGMRTIFPVPIGMAATWDMALDRKSVV